MMTCCNKESTGFLASTILFGLIAAGQFWRALTQIQVQFGGHTVPIWASFLAGSIALVMALWMGALYTRTTKTAT